jgi:hypothetical protein
MMDVCAFLILCFVGAVDASEDSMESSEEMVTPRAGADEEEKKGAASEVPVEVVEADVTAEEVMVDALPPEAAEREQEGKGDLRAEAHAVVQEPEVQDVVVSGAPEVLDPEAKNEEVVVRETAKVHPAHEPETTAEEVVVRETATASVVQKPEAKGEVSRSREADGAQTTEVHTVSACLPPIPTF